MEQSRQQKGRIAEIQTNPVCIKIIGDTNEYRDEYLKVVAALSGNEELPFIAAFNVSVPSGKGRKVGIGAVISVGCLKKSEIMFEDTLSGFPDQ